MQTTPSEPIGVQEQDERSLPPVSVGQRKPSTPVIGWLMQKVHGPIYRARIRELVRQIVQWLQPGDQVLDVGCGCGALGRGLMDDPTCPRGVIVHGLERAKRGGEAEINATVSADFESYFRAALALPGGAAGRARSREV